MQDPTTTFPQMKLHFPEQEQLKCPRCDSTKTKFCYYNNYNLSQPRHFCKNCRRYWTKGGALRNIPVGGGTRKNAKRPSNPKRSNPDPEPQTVRPARRVQESAPSTSETSTEQVIGSGNSDKDPTRVFGLEGDPDRKVLDLGGSFSSLLTSSGQFGSIFDGLNPNGSGLKMVQMDGFGEDLNSGLSGRDYSGLDVEGRENSNINGRGNSNSGGGSGEGYLRSGDWATGNGWPDLAIHTPGSSFQ